mmetsp:Transcript_26490/g.61801  ORF Transcript_26490/g.61801 Transcript_26490/m.61801 type:complete len:108 (-) Transcript_26490:124-447(-)
MPSHIEMGCEEALHQLLRPDIHHAIAPWMSQVGETEKRGMVRLVRAANPEFLDRINMPRDSGAVPRAAEGFPSHWYRATKREPVTLLTSTGKNLMQRSASGPALHHY